VILKHISSKNICRERWGGFRPRRRFRVRQPTTNVKKHRWTGILSKRTRRKKEAMNYDGSASPNGITALRKCSAS
jgi:hypothetical protein